MAEGKAKRKKSDADIQLDIYLQHNSSEDSETRLRQAYDFILRVADQKLPTEDNACLQHGTKAEKGLAVEPIAGEEKP